jgi:hypothetical protein
VIGIGSRIAGVSGGREAGSRRYLGGRIHCQLPMVEVVWVGLRGD